MSSETTSNDVVQVLLWFKNTGNEHFQGGRWTEAVDEYNKVPTIRPSFLVFQS
jgi:hypothetical protein